MMGEQKAMQEVLRYRNPLLSFLLIVIICANIVFVIGYFFYATSVFTSPVPLGMTHLLGTLCLSNIVFSLGIWHWMQWGAYGLYSNAVILVLINLYLGLEVFISLSGLLAPFFVFVCVRRRWHLFS